MNDRLKELRKAIRPEWKDLYTMKTARSLKESEPEKIKHLENTKLIDLMQSFPRIHQKSLTDTLKNRRSLRQYKDQPLTFEECSYVLWETARIDHSDNGRNFKTLPTAGATNSTETYVFINKVEGINQGLYLYHQDLHQLALLDDQNDIKSKVNSALIKQLRDAAMVVYFTHVLPRIEYKYAHVAIKFACIEAGHACQTLSLAADVIDSGVCAIGAYNQKETDDLLQLDGDKHFTIYCATLGKK